MDATDNVRRTFYNLFMDIDGSLKRKVPEQAERPDQDVKYVVNRAVTFEVRYLQPGHEYSISR